MDGSAVTVRDHTVGNSKALTCALANFLRSEEGIENPLLDVFGDPGSGVLDSDLNAIPD